MRFEVMQQHDDADCLHYVDPHYVASTRTSHRGYRYELGDAQHIALADLLHRLSGKVMLSGYPSDLYDRDLYRDWLRLEVPNYAQNAVRRTEVLWLNSAAANDLESETLFSGVPRGKSGCT